MPCLRRFQRKCNVFLQLIILRPHPHFTRHVRKKKSAKPSAFYTFENPQVRRSANPHFTVYTGAGVKHLNVHVHLVTTQLKGPYKPRTGRTGQCMNHAPAILAAPAVYCIHGRIIHQARGRQTVQNVPKKHAMSPSAATAKTHWPSS